MSAQAKEVEGEIVTGSLKLPEKESGLLAELNKSGKRLDTIEKDWAELPDVNTTAGLKLAKSRRAELVSMRTSGDANRKLITKPARDLVDSINGLWKKYVPRIEAVEKVYDEAIKAVELAKEKAKEENIAAEKLRVESIQERLEVIRSAPLRGTTIQLIDLELEVLDDKDSELFADFEEFAQMAEIHLAASMDALNKRRVELVVQAEEAKQLAEQKAEQDRIAEEQRVKDQEQADKEAKLEQDRKDFEAAKLAEDTRKENEAKALRVNMQSLIASIKAIPSKVKTLDDCMEARALLRSYHWDTAGDFKNEAIMAVTDSTMALGKREEEIKAENEKAKAKAAQEIEDARQLGIQQQKDREEEQRLQAEEDERARQAEAQRIAAMQPELERVRKWFEAIQGHNLPVIESAECSEVLQVFDKALDTMEEKLTALEMRKAA